MAWGRGSYRNWGFPPILTYDQAARHEAAVKPIRGDAYGTKPLGDRKKKYNSIIKDEATQDIIARLHNTDVVRYKPNGDIVVNNGGWATASTHDFLGALLHLPVRTFDSNSWISCYYQHSPMEEAVQGEYVMPNNVDITLRATGNGWATSDVVMPYTHKVNRVKANLVRKSYPSFTRYLRNMIKLRTELREKRHWTGETEVERIITVTQPELVELHMDARTQFLQLRKSGEDVAQNVRGMMLSDDPEKHYTAFVQIVRGAFAWGYIPAAGISVYANAIIDFYNQLLLFIHKYDVLERVPCDNGKAKRDPYGGWFK